MLRSSFSWRSMPSCNTSVGDTPAAPRARRAASRFSDLALAFSASSLIFCWRAACAAASRSRYLASCLALASAFLRAGKVRRSVSTRAVLAIAPRTFAIGAFLPPTALIAFSISPRTRTASSPGNLSVLRACLYALAYRCIAASVNSSIFSLDSGFVSTFGLVSGSAASFSWRVSRSSALVSPRAIFLLSLAVSIAHQRFASLRIAICSWPSTTQSAAAVPMPTPCHVLSFCFLSFNCAGFASGRVVICS